MNKFKRHYFNHLIPPPPPKSFTATCSTTTTTTTTTTTKSFNSVINHLSPQNAPREVLFRKEAYGFYTKMFPEPMVDVLGILLDACRTNGNKELGDIIANDILMLKLEDSGNYVQLAHSYASRGRWDGVGEAWIQMQSLGLKKLPGWSSIKLHGKITTFFSDHN